MGLLVAGLLIVAFAAGIILGFEWPKVMETVRRRRPKIEIGI